MTPPRRTFIPPAVQDNIERNAPEAAKARARRNRILSERVRGMRAAGAKAYDPGHQEKREIRDAEESTRDDGPVVRTEDTPDTGDPFNDHIYDATGYVYDYLMHVHGREGPDGRGGRLLSIIHYSEGGGNWDNAAYYRDPALGMIEVVGDGDIFPPFHLAPGVHAHEWGHALTEATCGLGYGNDEDGNMNEFGSDALCVLTEQWYRRQTPRQYHWLIGPELFSLGLHGRALRDCLIIDRGPAYDDPLLGADPQIATYDQFRRGMDPHVGSSIGNGWLAWAALQMPDRFAWEGIGLVWYDVWTGGRMTRGAGYKGFAQLTVEAATRLFGATSPELDAVRYGWDKVKVPIPTTPVPPAPDPAPVPADLSTCTDAEILSLVRNSDVRRLAAAVAAHPIGRRALVQVLRTARRTT